MTPEKRDFLAGINRESAGSSLYLGVCRIVLIMMANLRLASVPTRKGMMRREAKEVHNGA